jgi:chemotaxis methyl-accepting protein methylase
VNIADILLCTICFNFDTVDTVSIVAFKIQRNEANCSKFHLYFSYLVHKRTHIDRDSDRTRNLRMDDICSRRHTTLKFSKLSDQFKVEKLRNFIQKFTWLLLRVVSWFFWTADCFKRILDHIVSVRADTPSLCTVWLNFI